MDIWTKQKEAYEKFIILLDNLFIKWLEGGERVLPDLSDKLRAIASKLIKLDEYLNLSRQAIKIDELMAIIGVNVEKSLSPKVQESIQSLRAKIIEEQKKVTG